MTLARWRPWLDRLGLCLGLAGLVFVGFQLHAMRAQTAFAGLTALDYALLAGLAVTYGLCNLLLAAIWRIALQTLSVEVPVRWAATAFGRTQLAKYVPGNIFHLAGLYSVSSAAGIPAGASAKAVLYQQALIAAGSLPLIAPGAAAYLGVGLPLPVLVAAAGAIFVGGLFAVGAIDRRLPLALACAAAFHLAAGSIFYAALCIVSGPQAPVGAAALYAVSASVLAWLAGMLTPGAPAGLGVRELILIAALGASANGSHVVAAVVVGRCITMLGDALYFLASTWAGRKTPPPTGGVGP